MLWYKSAFGLVSRSYVDCWRKKGGKKPIHNSDVFHYRMYLFKYPSRLLLAVKKRKKNIKKTLRRQPPSTPYNLTLRTKKKKAVLVLSAFRRHGERQKGNRKGENTHNYDIFIKMYRFKTLMVPARSRVPSFMTCYKIQTFLD